MLTNPDNLRLRLNFLSELDFYIEDSRSLEVISLLPDDVLRKLKILFYEGESKKISFEKQTKLVEIKVDYRSLDLTNIKLKKLSVYAFEYGLTEATLKHQDEITSLKIYLYRYNDDQEIINWICSNLISLEQFVIEGSVDLNLVNLEKLKNLKKVRIQNLRRETLNTLNSKSLQSLELYHLSQESLTNIAIHCPNLRELCFLSTSDEVTKIDKVLQHLPKIEY